MFLRKFKMKTWISYTFKDCGSSFIEDIILFHDYVCLFIIIIVVFIFYIISFIIFIESYSKYFFDRVVLEVIWSVIPTFILLLLIMPTIRVLYSIEDVDKFNLTIKVVGHQWYWSYLYNYIFSDFYDSFSLRDDIILNLDSLPRSLSPYRSIVLPLNFPVRFVVTSVDVIHSFTIPSLGFKVDAVPGRLNQIFVIPNRLGVFYGQCSEICGSNHSFIPVRVNVVDLSTYFSLGLFRI